MENIERRQPMKAAGAAGIALATSGSTNMLVPGNIRAQGTALRAWPNRRLLDLLRIEHPIIQAPMGLHTSRDMPAAVSGSGGLGSLPCATLTPVQLRDVVGKIRARTSKPLNSSVISRGAMRHRKPLGLSAWAHITLSLV